jgi:hypothetical protein
MPRKFFGPNSIWRDFPHIPPGNLNDRFAESTVLISWKPAFKVIRESIRILVLMSAALILGIKIIFWEE